MNWLRGLAMLRHPEVRLALGEMRFRRRELKQIVSQFPDSKVDMSVHCYGYHSGLLNLGAHTSISAGSILAFGDESNGFGAIRIGIGTWVGQYNNLRASGDADIVIGDHCLISQFCTLVGSNHAIDPGKTIVEQGPDRSRLGVTLGDDVWLGAGVVVLPGIHIGDGAVIGANAVITHSVPAKEIWAGNPARKIGQRE